MKIFHKYFLNRIIIKTFLCILFFSTFSPIIASVGDRFIKPKNGWENLTLISCQWYGEAETNYNINILYKYEFQKFKHSQNELELLMRSIGYEILPKSVYLKKSKWEERYIKPLEEKRDKLKSIRENIVTEEFEDFKKSSEYISTIWELNQKIAAMRDTMFSSPWIQLEVESFDLSHSTDANENFSGRYSVSLMSIGYDKLFQISFWDSTKNYDDYSSKIKIYSITNSFNNTKMEIKEMIRTDITKMFNWINIAIRKGYARVPRYQ